MTIKKIIITTIFFLLVILSNGFCITKDENLLTKIFINSEIKLDELYSVLNVNKINAYFYTWSNETIGLYKKFNTDEEKKRVRDTKAAKLIMYFNNSLRVSLRISTFKNLNDAMLGYADITGYLPSPNCQKLFLNETLEVTQVKGSGFLLAKQLGEFNFVYKNSACCIDIKKENSDFTDADLKIINQIIKIIIKAIQHI